MTACPGKLPILVVLLAAGTAAAQDVVVGPADDWGTAINALQPGQELLLLPGRYTGRPTITVTGTPEEPVVVRGSGNRESVIDGETGGRALRIEDSADLVLENLVITNPSPYGNDLDGRRADFDYSGSARASLAEGMVIRGSRRVTVRNCLFTDVATRGVLIGESHDLVFERNIFTRVGDDTASGDIAAGSGASNNLIRGNLFAGNVDGVVHHAAGSGHLIEKNLFVFGKWENNIDLKFHWPRGSEDPWSTIRNNVIYAHEARYSGVELQDSSDNIRVVANVIRGAQVYGLQIRGRSGTLENLEVIGNWFHADGDGVGINLRVQSQDPGDVIGVWILHNIFAGYTDRATRLNHGEELYVYNNIFSACDPGAGAAVSAATNLYDGVTPWVEDTDPITGTPVYTEDPVGPLADGSPGKGQATILPDHDWGPDVGLPADFTGLPCLEAGILRDLRTVFTPEEIQEAMGQGGLTYTPNRPPGIRGITADPNPVAGTNQSRLSAGAEDPDACSPPLTYTWQVQSGQSGVAFDPNGNQSAATTVATFPASGTYVIEVEVSDGEDTATDQITLEVSLPVPDAGDGQADASPQIDAGDDGRTTEADETQGPDAADTGTPVSGSCGSCASSGSHPAPVLWILLLGPFVIRRGTGVRPPVPGSWTEYTSVPVDVKR